jgi:aspartate aminotransferase
MVKAFDDRRKKIVSSLRAIPGFECNMPQGAFYVFPYIDKIYQWDKFKELTKGKESVPKSKIFCDYLLEKYEVAAVPGEAFGPSGYLRFSYALGDEDIVEGIGRVAKLLGEAK